MAPGQQSAEARAGGPREVPMPLVLARRPRDKRGYPITAVTAILPDGTPDFGQIDQRLVLRCAAEDRCGLCGTPCGGLVAFIGGPVSDLDNPLAGYGNPAMHPGCAEAAVRICPYIAYQDVRWRHHDHQAAAVITTPPAKPDSWVLYATRTWTAYVGGISFSRPGRAWRPAERTTVTTGNVVVFRPGPPVRLRRFSYDDAGRIHARPPCQGAPS
jgi:hypothetical protein